jgi:tetratricopeptide (TPR) repeat protein
MASTEFRSPAHPEPPRQRLTSPWTLLGVALAVLITLVLIFPGSSLMTQSQVQTGVQGSVRDATGTSVPGSPVPGSPVPGAPAYGGGTSGARTGGAWSTGTASGTRAPGGAGGSGGKAQDNRTAALRAQVEKEPGNADARFSLAQRELELGKIGEARAALEPLYNSSDPAVRQRARMDDFKLQMQQLYAMKPGSRERERETERLRQELTAMSQYEWSPENTQELANLGGQIGARRARADLYRKLVKGDSNASRQSVEQAGRAVLSDGEYSAAAEIYFTAQERAPSREDKRHYFMQGVRALQAGNMPREAIAAADRNIGSLDQDDEILRFMIRLARASNDTKRAQFYTRKLMRMSEAGGVLRWLMAVADAIVPAALAADGEGPPPRTPTAGMRPYNAEDYQLAYEVFLGNRNLEDAYRVAAAAVSQVPGDIAWRERLAQISEWTSRPTEALEQWLYIARRTSRPAAWQAVLRLAPGAFDDEALLEAMRYQSAKGPVTDDQWRAIVDAYERVGRPREALTLLEREYARRPNPVLIELQATLLERMGDLEGSIAAYRRLIERSGATPQRVATLATLLMVRGDYKEAYQLLDAQRDKVTPEDAEYWRMLADLALQLQEDVSAERALNVLVKSTKAEPDDFNRLIALLQPRQPEAAARLAELGYQRFKTTDYLVAALGIYSGRRDFVSMRRVFAYMTPEVEAELAKSPDFLMLRAEYRNATGHPELARQDYRQALRIDPQHRFARLGFMWFLIDRRELEELRLQIPAAMAQGKNDVAFDGVLGAAWLTLGESARAVEYFARVLKRNPDDYLWLLNYADALEQNGEPDMAWRVRRHAWIKVRQEMAQLKGQRPPLELIQAHARLAVQSAPGDPAMAVMRNLMRQDQPLDASSADPTRRTLDAGTRDLVLSWAISSEQWISAKAWLWKQYSRNMVKPTWAESILAIAENDVETLQRLLDTQPNAIPRYDRHEAAEKTQQYRLAQDIAFNELVRRPNDDEMHLRLTNSVLNMYNYVEVGQTHFRRGVIDGRERVGELAVWLSPRLRLSVDVTHIDQGLHTPGVLATVPAHDTAYGMTALFRHAIGETRISVFHRDALAEFTGFRVSYGRPLGPRVSGRIGLGYNDRSTETSALSVGGVRDHAFIDLEYTLAKREYLLGQLSTSRFYTQDRTFVGSGSSLAWEAGHRFRIEYPDLHVRLAGSFNKFNQSGTGDELTATLNPGGAIPTSAFFLPPSFNVYGVYTGFGTFYRTNYTRAIRPFLDVGVSHNTVTGQGYGAILGASGAVFGGDRLTAYASTGRGGNGTNELSREVGLRYQYMFDRF